jgi:WD40 repeat protein/uncharacterized caspase-like protein
MPFPAAARFSLFLIASVAFESLPFAAPAQDQAVSPVLRIETGSHTAQIPGIAAPPSGRYLVTGSDDKTVRVWNAATGRLEETLRPPLGPGDEGKVYAVAVSPDGNTIACGGYTNAPGEGVCVYLFDRAGGRLRQRITGLPNVVLALAYSPDGRFLAATCGKRGLSVFHSDDGSPVAQDTQYADSCYSAAFDKSGRLVTASLDGYIRLYDAGFNRLARRPAPGGRFPWSAVFSPDGTKIAVGYYDSATVSIVSAKDLSSLSTPDTHDIHGGNLKNVTWSPDGRFLYAAGSYQQSGQFPVRRWEDGGRGASTDLKPGARDTIAALWPLPNGDLAWSGTDPVWGILTDTQPRLTEKSRITDLRAEGDDFRLSTDGATVQFRDGVNPGTQVVFSLAHRQLAVTTDPSPGLASPVTQADGMTVTDWNGSSSPKLNGQPLTLTGHEASEAVAVAPSSSSFLLGTSQNVRCFDKSGHELWHTASPEVTLAVNVAPGGKVGAAAFGDGTIHWYRMSDGQELLALFPSADHTRWLAWTPAGYYDCSPGGEDFVGWQINQGGTQAADFYPASRFRSAYYRPTLIARALPSAKGTAPVVIIPPPAPSVTQILPPVVRILAPDDGGAFSTGQVTVRYAVRTPSGEPAAKVRVLVDGRPVSEQRDLRLVSAGSTESAPQQITVTLPPHDCEISVVAENRYAPSEPATIQMKWQGASSQGTSDVKPKLYVLAIGISKYHDATLNLQYGASDALDFAKTLQAQDGRLYRDVQEKILTDGTATKANIVAGLQWIRTQTTGKDVAMIFLAGHGANDPDTGSYLYIPQDFNPNKVQQTAVPYTDIKATVQSIPGKALFFIDTCHAGDVMGTRRILGSANSLHTLSCGIIRTHSVWAVGDAMPFGGVPDVTSVINELTSAENGVVVFSASTGNQVSYEDAAWGHGAFTKALVEGLNGGADYQHTGRITVNMLDLYLSERVKELTKGAQTPTTTKPETVPDFPVVVLHS